MTIAFPLAPDPLRPGSATLRVAALVLLDGWNLLSVAAAADLMNASGKISCKFVTLPGTSACSSTGNSLILEHSLDALDSCDLILIFGGDAEPPPLTIPLRRAMVRGAQVCAIGSAVFVLAEAGLLLDRDFTLDRNMTPRLFARWQNLQPRLNLFSIDRQIATCPDGQAVADLVLQLLQDLFGTATVRSVMQHCMISKRRLGSELQMPPPHTISRKLHNILRFLSQNFHRPDILEAVSIRSSVSRRQLERLFRTRLGITPSQYVQSLRLSRAQQLLASTDRPVADIAQAVGFLSAAHFSKLYRRRYGCSPHKIDLFS